MEFSEWINAKYIEARGRNRLTIDQFAKQIGVSQTLMSHWMRPGSKPPNAVNLGKLAQRFPDVYSALGIAPPGESLPLNHLPTDLRRRLVAAGNEVNRVLAERNLNAESPEAAQIIIEIFEAHGFKHTSTEYTDSPDSPS